MLEVKRRKGRPSADQTDVWGCVDHVLSDAGSASPTRSLTDAFKSRREQLDVLRSTLRLPPGAVGFMLGAEGRIVGLDLFGETSTADRYWPRLSEAYFLEAVKMPQTADPVPVESARRFLTEVRNHAVVTPKAIGLGREIELKTDGMTGQGLLWRGRIVHLSAFERPSWDDR